MSNEKTPRPTHELVTTFSGHKVVLRDWITVAEFDSIKNVFRKTAKTAKIDAKAETAEFSGDGAMSILDAEQEAEKVAFELVVVSIDEKTEGLYEWVYENMRNEDGLEIFAAVNEVTSPTKKKNLETRSDNTPVTGS